MRKRFVRAITAVFLFAAPMAVSSQTLSQQDSLILVELYNGTDGPHWLHQDNWLSTAPINTWYGIRIFSASDIMVDLRWNNLRGPLPADLGDLKQVTTLSLDNNKISGGFPPSLFHMSQLWGIYLTYNDLSGPLPDFSQGKYSTYATIDLRYNKLTLPVTTAQPDFMHTFVQAFPQADIPLIKDGPVLSVAAGGIRSNNIYKWYNDTVLVATVTGDSTYTANLTGSYHVEVYNNLGYRLALYSATPLDAQDSLALVDLYNSTVGNNWYNHENWLTPTSAANWYGVTVRNGHVKELVLETNNLGGTLPESIGALNRLETLDLVANHIGSTIPTSIGNLTALQALILSGNQLSGAIPSSIGSLGSLTNLVLMDNSLTDSIPPSLGNLTHLTNIGLAANQLTGDILTACSHMPNLYWLDVRSNRFGGNIPASLANLTNVAGIQLSNNQFSGNLPDSLRALVSIGRFEIDNNRLSGKLPAWLDSLPQLFSLDVHNNQFSGPIPNLSDARLAGLYLQNNQFNFSGMESLPHVYEVLEYSPQASIHLSRDKDTISLAAGGTLSNNTYRLFKNGTLLQTQTGDSLFSVTEEGSYFITATNAIAQQLTLTSDTLKISIQLADTATSVTRYVNATGTTEFIKGVYKLLALTPSGANALNGNVTASVSLDTSVNSYNGVPYVQRHYEVAPETNAATATATVTLYFTQQDFDQYNSYVQANQMSLPLLPTGGVDNGNVRITQYHGSFTGSSAPGNYAGGVVIIIPNVSWDALNGWWTITFPVTGFSGFFISTGGNTALPVSLIQFKGNAQSNGVALEWFTGGEMHMLKYEVERSDKTAVFSSIGSVPAQGITDYNFLDTRPFLGDNLYRLKMLDQNGSYIYSPTLTIHVGDKLKFAVFPNPFMDEISIAFTTGGSQTYRAEIYDADGRLLLLAAGVSADGANQVRLNTRSLKAGGYAVRLICGEEIIGTGKIEKIPH